MTHQKRKRWDNQESNLGPLGSLCQPQREVLTTILLSRIVQIIGEKRLSMAHFIGKPKGDSPYPTQTVQKLTLSFRNEQGN